jgi:micrococcal nuclease
VRSTVAPLAAILLTLLGFLGGSQYQKSLTPTTPATPSYPSSATVQRIIDGDTIGLDTNQSVRLYGISCPDFGDPFHDEATDFTTNLTENQTITLEYEQGYESDRFGRLLAYIIVDDTNLNIELARQGLAEVVLYEKRRKLIYQDELLEAQAHAKENNLGIWSTGD